MVDIDHFVVDGQVLDEHRKWIPFKQKITKESEFLSHLESGEVLCEGKWVPITDAKKFARAQAATVSVNPSQTYNNPSRPTENSNVNIPGNAPETEYAVIEGIGDSKKSGAPQNQPPSSQSKQPAPFWAATEPTGPLFSHLNKNQPEVEETVSYAGADLGLPWRSTSTSITRRLLARGVGFDSWEETKKLERQRMALTIIGIIAGAVVITTCTAIIVKYLL